MRRLQRPHCDLTGLVRKKTSGKSSPDDPRICGWHHGQMGSCVGGPPVLAFAEGSLLTGAAVKNIMGSREDLGPWDSDMIGIFMEYDGI